MTPDRLSVAPASFTVTVMFLAEMFPAPPTPPSTPAPLLTRVTPELIPALALLIAAFTLTLPAAVSVRRVLASQTTALLTVISPACVPAVPVVTLTLAVARAATSVVAFKLELSAFAAKVLAVLLSTPLEAVEIVRS